VVVHSMAVASSIYKHVNSEVMGCWDSGETDLRVIESNGCEFDFHWQLFLCTLCTTFYVDPLVRNISKIIIVVNN